MLRLFLVSNHIYILGKMHFFAGPPPGGNGLTMTVPTAAVLVDGIPFLCPPDKGKYGLTELFPVFGQGILNSRRDF